ncbi:MAG: polysaccharide biosynthesis C-terminal domain-containing protein [Candidatus Aureabacteria bacterium]|nr:polysaccharide biosynthesis C-terminal domain-containing protein [Candidatus Auribacterota bacterium]
MSKKKEILKHTAVYSAANIITQAVGVIGAILSRKFLGPVQVGIWAVLQVVLNFAKYITLGTTTAINIEIPYQIGKKDEKAADKIKNITFSFITIVSTVVAIGIIVYTFLFREKLSEELFYGLIFVSIIIILQRINNFFISILRAYKNFYIAGKQMVLSAIINVILVGVLSYFFKIYGFMWATGLSLIFNIVYIYYHKRYKFKIACDWKQLKKLILFGLPLRVLGLMGTLFRSIDRIMIIGMIGYRFMGFYSIAIMACNYLTSIHTSLAVVLLPHFQEKFGEKDDKNDLRKYLSQSAAAFSDFLPIVIGLTYICAPYFIGLLLKKFVEGIPALKFLVLSIYFVALGNVYGNYLITIRKYLVMYPLIIISCILSVILNYLAIASGYGIVGVAIATTVSLAFHFTVIFLAAASTIFSTVEIVRYYAAIMCKFLLMAALLFSMDRFVMKDELSILNVFTCVVIYSFLYIPFLIKMNRDFDVLKNIKERFLKNRQNAR